MTRAIRHRQPARGLRPAITGTALIAAVAASVLGTPTANADPKPTSSVASLVNEIATVDQDLAVLADDAAAKRQNVNRTLVDFQNAVAAKRVAVAADDSAKASLQKSRDRIDAAQREFDEFMRSVNRQGNNMGSMTEYVASDDPDKILEQMSAVENTGRKQRATIENLRVARNQQANRVAATAATRRQAEMAARGATARRQAALVAAQEAEAVANRQQAKRDDLMRQRAELTARLDAAKGRKQTSGPVTGRDVAEALRNLPRDEAAEGDLAGGATGAVTDIALEAGAQVLTALLGDLTLPDSELLSELGLAGSAPLSTGPNGTISRVSNGSLGSLFGGMGGGGGGPVRPGLRGPEAVELVVERAMSTLGTPYSWGGGNATGPTLGVRDGGVADMHGDYAKVGYDCSGLMVYAFAGIGVELPKYSGYQYTAGPKYPAAEMQRGDMIFWGKDGSQHVALYLGNGEMIEAPQSGGVVQVAPVKAGHLPWVVRMT